MNVVAANLRPLPSKHYSTEVNLVVNVGGWNYNLYIDISGYAPVASTSHPRAISLIAKTICACLKEAQLTLVDGVDL